MVLPQTHPFLSPRIPLCRSCRLLRRQPTGRRKHRRVNSSGEELGEAPVLRVRILHEEARHEGHRAGAHVRHPATAEESLHGGPGWEGYGRPRRGRRRRLRSSSVALRHLPSWSAPAGGNKDSTLYFLVMTLNSTLRLKLDSVLEFLDFVESGSRWLSLRRGSWERGPLKWELNSL